MKTARATRLDIELPPGSEHTRVPRAAKCKVPGPFWGQMLDGAVWRIEEDGVRAQVLHRRARNQAFMYRYTVAVRMPEGPDGSYVLVQFTPMDRAAA